ncbi:MAG: VIT and VWA domain-containing protein [Planctomycetota bacterium]
MRHAIVILVLLAGGLLFACSSGKHQEAPGAASKTADEGCGCGQSEAEELEFWRNAYRERFGKEPPEWLQAYRNKFGKIDDVEMRASGGYAGAGGAAGARAAPWPKRRRSPYAGIVAWDADADEVWVIERYYTEGGDTDVERAPAHCQLQAKVADVQVPMPLEHTAVEGEITLHLATVKITQRYKNPYDQKIEAVYTFPLPQNAAVSDFLMKIGDRTIRGIVREKEEAKRIYKMARRHGHVASLLQQDRPNVFTQSVANIEPQKSVDIEITYFHTLRFVDNEYEFVLPTVVGPRFNPPGRTDGIGAVGRGSRGHSGQAREITYLKPNEISSHELSFSVNVNVGAKIAKLYSPTHAIVKKDLGENRVQVTLRESDNIPNRDILLRYRLADPAEVRARMVTFEAGDGGGYFLMVLDPPRTAENIPQSPREMVFVLDCSGSMQGQPLETSKRAVRRALRRLDQNDTFQVIRFSNQASPMGSRPLPATPKNIKKGLRYLDSLEAKGGTMMEYGIHAALKPAADAERRRIVTFLTDGYIGNEKDVLRIVKNEVGDSRIFSFGVGSSVNRYLLERMASHGRGVATYVRNDESSRRAVDGLYKRLERPALANVSLKWAGAGVSDIEPAVIPDLFVGRPVVIAGRYSGTRMRRLFVTGTVGGKPREIVVDLGDPVTHPAIAKVWARARIAGLHDAAISGQVSQSEAAGEIRQTALQHGLVSDFTSFVAVDSLSRTAGTEGTTVRVAVPVPDGVKYETTVDD